MLELADLIAACDADDLVYGVIVEHAGGTLEVHAWDGFAAVIRSVDEAVQTFGDDRFLPHDEPVRTWPCDLVEHIPALSLLNGCARCA